MSRFVLLPAALALAGLAGCVYEDPPPTHYASYTYVTPSYAPPPGATVSYTAPAYEPPANATVTYVQPAYPSTVTHTVVVYGQPYEDRLDDDRNNR